MKRTITIASLLLFAAAGSAMAELRGAWTGTTEGLDKERIHMNMVRGGHNQHGNTMKIASFTGLSSAQIWSPTQTPVQFQLAREAGTVRFEGTFKNGDGAGQFTFQGNPSYASTIRALGVEFELKKHRKDRTEEEELFTLALLDVSTAYIKSMQDIGYRVSLQDYISMRIFNVTPEYVREMAAAGFKDLSSDKLVATRIHKVTPDYIRQMRAAGWNLSLDELMSSRIHKATPEFAEEMRKLGYGNLDFDDLVSFRIHRVTPEFISQLRELGYDNISADNLIAMRIHRVTPEFIKELKAAGYSNVPVRKLIDMKIHKVDVKFIESMNKVD